MAMFLFTDAILNNRPIKVFNNGNLSRDFTYIDDITSGVNNIICNPRKPSNNYNIYNIGNSNPVKLLDFINLIELELGKKAKKKYLEMQAGDVNSTWASIKKIKSDYDYEPKTTIKKGVKKFIKWYKDYYKINLNLWIKDIKYV